jgi:hypothetical protein
MRERDLEQLMVDFYHRRFNLLVCTTIIESGIDVPTANTIMIDRADKLGLAQLHQLRGRVGPLAPSRLRLSADAAAQGVVDRCAKRLEAIESLEELGAGFVLATHDLEIRGAGELLGESQSGELTEIGLTLYLDLLEQAVKAMKEGREPGSRPARWPPRPRWNCACLRCCRRVTSPMCRCAWRCTSGWPPRPTMRHRLRSPKRSSTGSGPCRRRPRTCCAWQDSSCAHARIGIRRLDLAPRVAMRVRGTEPGGPARGHTAGAASRP